MKIPELAERAAEDATLIAVNIESRLAAIRDAQAGNPGAQRYDGAKVHGHTTVADDEGWSMPAVSDPTGEAGTATCRARADEDELEDVLQRACRLLDRAVNILRAYGPRSPNVLERSATSTKAPPGCKSCARLKVERVEEGRAVQRPRWEPVYRTVQMPDGTREGRCRWCWDWNPETRERPPLRALRDHHAGKRVTRPAQRDTWRTRANAIA